MKTFSKYLLLWGLIITACADDDGVTDNSTSEQYFPARVGYYQRYQVDEIRYSAVAAPETLSYQLRQVVVDSFMNVDNQLIYVVHRSTRSNDSELWEFQETRSLRVTSNEAVEIEGNVPFVKLKYPLKSGSEWDGNRLNNRGEDEYAVIDFDQTVNVGETTFEHAITIEQEYNDDPIVYTDLRKEIYAPNVGLILKEITQLVFCQEQTCSGNELIESGVIFKQQILDYGIE